MEVIVLNNLVSDFFISSCQEMGRVMSMDEEFEAIKCTQMNSDTEHTLSGSKAEFYITQVLWRYRLHVQLLGRSLSIERRIWTQLDSKYGYRWVRVILF